jgi:hypothetical protein
MARIDHGHGIIQVITSAALATSRPHQINTDNLGNVVKE